MLSDPGDVVSTPIAKQRGHGESCLSEKAHAPRGTFPLKRLDITFREVPTVASSPDASTQDFRLLVRGHLNLSSVAWKQRISHQRKASRKTEQES